MMKTIKSQYISILYITPFVMVVDLVLDKKMPNFKDAPSSAY